METGEERTPAARAEAASGGCSCSDPYAALPAELRPKPQAGNAGLRQTTCPTCGLVFWTNRVSDVCIACTAG
jgi:hypothetical protein